MECFDCDPFAGMTPEQLYFLFHASWMLLVLLVAVAIGLRKKG